MTVGPPTDDLGSSSARPSCPATRGACLLSIDVPDVDALLPQVERLGGTATSGANDMPWGQRVAHIKDPDGNVVNLTQQL